MNPARHSFPFQWLHSMSRKRRRSWNKHFSRFSVETTNNHSVTMERSHKDLGRPHSPQCYSLRPSSVMNTGPVCCREKRGPLSPHTNTQIGTNTHINAMKQIFHTHWLQPARPFNMIFSSDTHTRTHTMRLIDYFTKNQLGAGYVRSLRAKRGENHCEQ